LSYFALPSVSIFTGTPYADFVDITVKKVMGDDDLLTEDTSTYPSLSMKLDEGAGISNAATDSQDKPLRIT
jgi:hypothetical protein